MDDYKNTTDHDKFVIARDNLNNIPVFLYLISNITNFLKDDYFRIDQLVTLDTFDILYQLELLDLDDISRLIVQHGSVPLLLSDKDKFINLLDRYFILSEENKEILSNTIDGVIQEIKSGAIYITDTDDESEIDYDIYELVNKHNPKYNNTYLYDFIETLTPK